MGAVENFIEEVKEIAARAGEEAARRVLAEQRETQTPPPYRGEYISIKHASELFDISENTLRDWVRRRKIKRHKIQGCVRIKVSDLVKSKGDK
jgi:predicted HTH domain antitoxin